MEILLGNELGDLARFFVCARDAFGNVRDISRAFSKAGNGDVFQISFREAGSLWPLGGNLDAGWSPWVATHGAHDAILDASPSRTTGAAMKGLGGVPACEAQHLPITAKAPCGRAPLPTEDGVGTGLFEPRRAGVAELRVQLGGHDIDGSPFHPFVMAASAVAEHSTVISTGTDQVHAGCPGTLLVTTRDSFGNASEPSAPPKAVLYRGGRMAEGMDEASSAGNTPKRLPSPSPSTREIPTITRDGIAALDDEDAPSELGVVMGTKVAQNDWNHAEGAGDAGDAPVLSGPNVGLINVSVISLGDGTFEARYTAKEAGTYLVSITLHGKSIRGSPFSVLVWPAEVHSPACR